MKRYNQDIGARESIHRLLPVAVSQGRLARVRIDLVFDQIRAALDTRPQSQQSVAGEDELMSA